MKKLLSPLFALVLSLSLLCACGSTESGKPQPLFSSNGSVEKLSGKTLIVSIFVDDTQSSWQWDAYDARDNSMAYTLLHYTGIACLWLTERAAEYGMKASFVYDWSADNDLYYGTVVPFCLTDYMTHELYEPVRDIIIAKIDTPYLLNKYNADNIAYLVFANTAFENPVHSCAYNSTPAVERDYEFSFIFAREGGAMIAPAVIAHELLHLFGAPDLYYPDESYGISAAYVESLRQNQSDDIMFNLFAYGEKITNTFSPLDAAFVGLSK